MNKPEEEEEATTIRNGHPIAKEVIGSVRPASLIGALRNDAALLDQAVEHAMRIREERPWRVNPLPFDI